MISSVYAFAPGQRFRRRSAKCAVTAIRFAQLSAVSISLSTSADSVSTTVYVGKHFEVRDHDQPVKYVFNGDTRVARITGSLSSAMRIQRIRLRNGWNLITLAVTAANLAGQFSRIGNGSISPVSAVYRWDSSTRRFELLGDREDASAGSVLWVRATTNVIAGIQGNYVESLAPHVDGGGDYVAGPGLQAWPLQLPAGVSIWMYDSAAHRWLTGFAGDLAAVSDLPPMLSAGEAIYIHTTGPVDLGIPAPEHRVVYYHPDHLGSSTVLTDVAGQLMEETAYHPFGVARNESIVKTVDSAYAFTQKERDGESRLHYFEARYLKAPLSRFLTPDLKFANVDSLSDQERSALQADPQRLNLYSYVRNNPLKYTDPSGQWPWPEGTVRHLPRAAEVHPTAPGPLAQRVEPSREMFFEPPSDSRSTLMLSGVGEIKVESIASLKRGVGESRSTDQSGEFSIVISGWSPELIKAAREGKEIESGEITLRTKGGEVILKLQIEDVSIDYRIGSRQTITLHARRILFPDEKKPTAEHGEKRHDNAPTAGTAASHNSQNSGIAIMKVQDATSPK